MKRKPSAISPRSKPLFNQVRGGSLKRGVRSFGLIGFPLSHSLSPGIHQFLFSIGSYPGEYHLIPMENIENTENIENIDFIHLNHPHRNGFKGRDNPLALPESPPHYNDFFLGYSGLNVTTPHKERVVHLCQSLCPVSRFTGGCNTLLQTETGIHGFNTDGGGGYQFLKLVSNFSDWEELILYGCGITGGSLLYSFLKTPPPNLKKITIINRSPQRVDFLLEQSKIFFPDYSLALTGFSWEELRGELPPVSPGTVFINATHLGSKSRDEIPHFNPKPSTPFLVIMDTHYQWKNNPILAQVPDSTIRLDGRGMLFMQAFKAQQIFRNDPLEFGWGEIQRELFRFVKLGFFKTPFGFDYQ